MSLRLPVLILVPAGLSLVVIAVTSTPGAAGAAGSTFENVWTAALLAAGLMLIVLQFVPLAKYAHVRPRTIHTLLIAAGLLLPALYRLGAVSRGNSVEIPVEVASTALFVLGNLLFIADMRSRNRRNT